MVHHFWKPRLLDVCWCKPYLIYLCHNKLHCTACIKWHLLIYLFKINIRPFLGLEFGFIAYILFIYFISVKVQLNVNSIFCSVCSIECFMYSFNFIVNHYGLCMYNGQNEPIKPTRSFLFFWEEVLVYYALCWSFLVFPSLFSSFLYLMATLQAMCRASSLVM